MKTLIIGNTGSGKSAMAKRLIGVRDIPWLSLDEVAWSNAGETTCLVESIHLADSLGKFYEFVEQNDQWVIEACHGDLVEAAIPYCTELRFLNPGCEDCINRCLNKPRKFRHSLDNGGKESAFDRIISWVGKYGYRDHDGEKRHRDLFESFSGPKKEYMVVIY